MSDPIQFPASTRNKSVADVLADAAAEGFDHIVVVGIKELPAGRVQRAVMQSKMTLADTVFELECAKKLTMEDV